MFKIETHAPDMPKLTSLSVGIMTGTGNVSSSSFMEFLVRVMELFSHFLVSFSQNLEQESVVHLLAWAFIKTLQ